MSFSPIVLFAYNRPTHTQRTLDALSSNPEAKESDLYIYCDGPKSKITDNDFNKIKQVRFDANIFAIYRGPYADIANHFETLVFYQTYACINAKRRNEFVRVV
mgnify:CR=1 FL=1